MPRAMQRHRTLPQIRTQTQTPPDTLHGKCSHHALLQGMQWETPIAPAAALEAVTPDKWKLRSTSDEAHPNEEWECDTPRERPGRHDADTSRQQPPRDAPSAIREDDEAIPAHNSFCGSESCDHRIPAGFHIRYCIDETR